VSNLPQILKCPNCGGENPKQARFCGICGDPFDKVSCAFCGAPNSRTFKFCIKCGKSVEGEDNGSDELTIAAAQRRLLTIMFCDLVNSTGLTEVMEPETMRGLIRSFQQACERISSHYGGRVTEYPGDGVVVQFTGHEDSAERALRSALEISESVSRIKIGGNFERDFLAVRSGVATGMAIVGDHLGQGNHQVESSVGLPSNLAKRIQGIAQPNEVIISDQTHDLIQGLFQCKDLGWHPLKGFSTAHRVWRVLGEENIDFRFQASHKEMTPIVDRAEVMEILLRRWHRTNGGSGQVVVITGEPGIGKSRIIQEVDQRLTEAPHFVFRYQCSPHHRHTALYPVIARIGRVAGFRPGDPPARRLEKLERFLRVSWVNVESIMPIFARLMSLSGSDRYPAPEIEPVELKRKTLQMLVDSAVSLAARSPLLVQLEDAHWIDPTSLEMLNLLVGLIRQKPIMLLVSTRPEFAPSFISLPQVTCLTINRLSEEHTRELVRHTWSTSNLTEEYLRKIVDRSEGIPLFAEELSKTVIENMQDSSESEVKRTFEGKLDMPATLQDSLLARLDHLPVSARTAAQIGAAIGRDFAVDLLVAVIGIDEEKVRKRLDQLVWAEVVTRRSSSQDEVLVFNHALMRDAAYQSLLRSDRTHIHARIAAVVEERFPALSDTNPELLAHHWQEAGNYEKSLPWWLAAGKLASERFANTEAASHLNQGLALLDRLPKGQKWGQWELEFRVALMPVLRVSEGAGAEQTRQNSERAVELCDLLPESPEQFAALWGKWVNAMSFKLELGLEWTDRLEALAKKLGDSGLMLQVHHSKWTTLFHVGRPAEAYQHVRQGLVLYDEQAHRNHAFVYGGHDPRVCAGSFAAHALWLLGYPDQALDYARNCRHWASRLNHIGSSLHVIELHLLQYQFRREPENLLHWLDQLKGICSENTLPEYEGKMKYCRGWVLASRGETDEGLELMQAGLETQRALGSFEDIALFSDQLAEVLAAVGQPEVGLKLLGQTLQIVDLYSLRYWLAEVHRRKGELLLLCGKKAAAKSSFEQALETARQQQAKSLELRAAMSLARWHADNGNSAGGLKILQPVYRWFTEGLETKDLKEAACCCRSWQ